MVAPALRQHTMAVDDAVVSVQLAEPGEVACRRIDVRRSDEGAGGVELRDRAVHPHRREQSVVEKRLHPRATTSDDVTDDPADDVRGAAGVVPRRAGAADQRQRSGVGGHVVLALAEEHRDAVAHRIVDVVLDPFEPGPHLQQVEQRDRFLGRSLPTRHRCRTIELDQTITDQDADRGVRDALGHAPRDQRGLRRDCATRREDRVRLHAVPLEHQLTATHHQQREADTVRCVVSKQLVGNLQDGCVHGDSP